MPIQQWSEGILVVDLADEPQLTEDLQLLSDRIEKHGPSCVVLNMAGLRHISSSHISALLRVRTKLSQNDKRMRICCVPNMIWGVMLVTGLDKVFEFSPDVPSALASLQLEA
jgi:anti-anti-sigma factor